jgi:hypothetical protein
MQGLVLSLLALAAFLTQYCLAVGANSIPYGSACGVERWSIKTLMDAGARSLPTTPKDTSIPHLVSFKAPVVPDAVIGRVPGMETSMWRVRAELVGYRVEKDSDYHLVLRDPQTGEEMVAEIPGPYCTSSPKASAFAVARRAVDEIGRHAATRRFWWLDYRGASPPVVLVTGYGFFDQLHDVDGQARNGAELHPVISVAPAKQ